MKSLLKTSSGDQQQEDFLKDREELRTKLGVFLFAMKMADSAVSTTLNAKTKDDQDTEAISARLSLKVMFRSLQLYFEKLEPDANTRVIDWLIMELEDLERGVSSPVFSKPSNLGQGGKLSVKTNEGYAILDAAIRLRTRAKGQSVEATAKEISKKTKLSKSTIVSFHDQFARGRKSKMSQELADEKYSEAWKSEDHDQAFEYLILEYRMLTMS
jgi:hypothetical protein